MANGSQLLLLTLKNLKIKARNGCGTAIEVIFPLLCLSLLIAIIVSAFPSDPNFSPIPIGFAAENKVTYGPDVPAVRALMLSVVGGREELLHLVDTEAEMTALVLDAEEDYVAGVYFRLTAEELSGGWLSDDITYSLRVDGKGIPKPATLIDYVSNTDGTNALWYTIYFVGLQQRVDQAIIAAKIEEKTGVAGNLTLGGYATRFPVQEGEPELDKRWQLRNSVLKPIGGTWLTFCLLFSVYRLVGTIITEKKTKVRDTMRMMGMRVSTTNVLHELLLMLRQSEFYWLTWFLVSLALIVPILVICSVLLKYLNFFPLASIGIIFIAWLLYAASLLTFAMILSAILNSAKSSGLITILGVVLLSIAGEGIVLAEMHAGVKILLSLFSPVAFNMVVNILAEAENTFQVIDEHTGDFIGGSPSLNSMLAMLVCDTVLYLVIAWYIDNVKTSGTKKAGCFCFRGSYWGRRKNTASPKLDGPVELDEFAQPDENFERMDQVQPPVVKIQRLRKEFEINNRPFLAVDGFTLDMHESQIIALLGHNGAGKTTLISMLTGSLDPSAGEAAFYGHNLRDRSALKKMIGICPQHDAIWPQLTVYEHLQLFGGFKGVAFNKIKEEAEQLITDFELDEKRDYPAGKLSGGQKRRLSIAIALIGGSKVIFLDEPSAGMDPEARRVVWDNLTKYKQGRVIILTTHFMDEADYLGDQVAIMRHGKLLCAGSSLFLKNRFGLGYTLNCVKQPDCRVEALTEFLRQYADVQVLSNVGAEATFRLPREEFAQLPQLLSDIEAHKHVLGVTSYGIGQSTLEEVFLELNKESDLTGIAEHALTYAVSIPATEPSHRRQLNALLHKRLESARRDGKFLFIQFAVPILLCVAAFVVQRLLFTQAAGGEVALNGQIYSQFVTPWANDQCATNYFSALPRYTPDAFPQHAVDEIGAVLRNISTFAAGAVVFDSCLAAGPTQALQYGLYYNASASHSLGYHQNLLSNAVLNTALLGYGPASITTINNPAGLPIDLVSNLINVIIFLLILIGTCVLSASITAYIFQERELGIKQLQLASGTNARIYWLSNFLWDFVQHMVIFIVIMIIANAVDWGTFGGARIGAELILIILYSMASISAAYFCTCIFSGSSSGQGATLGLFLGLSFGFLTLVNAVNAAMPAAQDTMTAVSYALKAISPHFLLITAFGQLTNSIGSDSKYLVTSETNIFEVRYWGSTFIIFAGQFLVYGGLTLLLENMDQFRLARIRSALQAEDTNEADADEDVAAERASVQHADLTDTEATLVWVKGLRKAFNANTKLRKVAVNNFSLRIPRGESFGLLGANGAGKTTTLKMLSGQLLPTRGEISINGHSYHQLSRILQSIGFCPQYDTLIPKLSGRAHLQLFAELRGLPKAEIPSIIEALIKTIHLTKYADRPCGKYSGGNKRKLSLALALIGNPPVLYLDEPSTGMDPLARRFMWNVITAVRANKAIILTTHSMEECEALCTRLGIMIGGKLRCVGSPQHLKTKFGNGYRLELKTSPEHIEHIPKFIQKISPHARLIDHHTTLFNYEIPMQGLTLGQLLERVEKVKEKLNIIDYAVSQTTLEQVFITMAQEHLQHPSVVIEQ